MQIRKFCLCGCKLERQASDEETARQVVMAWWKSHTGAGHGPATEREYLRAVSRIVGNNAAPNHPKEFRPMLSPKMRFRLIK